MNGEDVTTTNQKKVVVTIFDPLDFFGNFTIKGKILMEEI